MLEPSDEAAEFLPGNIFGLLMEDALEVIKIGTDVGTVAVEGMVRKTAK